jgi:predicted dehydrogenase
VYLTETWRNFAAEQWHSIVMEPVPVYQLAVEDFVKAVQLDECVPIDAWAARQVLDVVLAIYRSAAERRTISIN